MRRSTSRSLFPASVLSCFLLAGAPVFADNGSTPASASAASVDAHVAAATDAAGTDLKALLVLCKAPPTARKPQSEIDKGLAAQIARPRPEPGQAFDNLYYVGAAWVSAWALKTSDGIILIDALNNQEEAADLIEGGLRKVGMDPAQIKYLIVTHGHGDHYGGAPYLVQKYHPRVIMSESDWKMTETKLEFESSLWGPPPKRDLSVVDGDKITLGDTTVTLYVTPGHTGGTIAPVFDVRSGSQSHRVLLWGGTAFNFGKDIPRLDGYIDATQRMSGIVQQQDIDVMLSNHAGYDGSLQKLEAMRKQPDMQPKPFVLGTPTVTRALKVMNECARATRDRFTLQP